MDWHRLFGQLLTDYFPGSPFRVDIERDLSLKQQFLDVIIIRRRKGRFSGLLPDGLDDLATHNLITFKSHQESLTDWALKELTGDYVAYRKLLSEGDDPLLPESEFKLYAVCSRYPHNLANEVPWQQVREGVYNCRRGTDVIQVVVVGQLPQTDNNAPLHLFSAAAAQVQFGASHYRRHSPDTSSLLNQLFQGYRAEGITMPYTMEDFRKDYAKAHFKDLTPEEQQEVLQSLSPQDRQRVLQGLPAQERLEGLSQADLERTLAKMRAEEPSRPPTARNRRKS
jgi:hypothetical protein